MEFHKSDKIAEVGVLAASGMKNEKIAKKVGLSHNQVMHIRSYYFSKKNKPNARIAKNRRAKNEVVTTKFVPTKPTNVVTEKKGNDIVAKQTKMPTIRFGNVTIEFEDNIVRKAIIGKNGIVIE